MRSDPAIILDGHSSIQNTISTAKSHLVEIIVIISIDKIHKT